MQSELVSMAHKKKTDFRCAIINNLSWDLQVF